jgi:hypothetical protein
MTEKYSNVQEPLGPCPPHARNKPEFIVSIIRYTLALCYDCKKRTKILPSPGETVRPTPRAATTGFPTFTVRAGGSIVVQHENGQGSPGYMDAGLDNRIGHVPHCGVMVAKLAN